MKNNHGGNMLIEGAILILILASLVLLYFVKVSSKKPSKETLEIGKSVESIFGHIENIDATNDLQSREIKQIDTNFLDLKKVREDREEELIELIGECKDEIAKVKGWHQELSKRVSAIPREIRVINKTQQAPLKFQGMEVRGYEWLTVKKGKKVKAVKYWTVPQKKNDKFRMPGVKEAKSKIVEAGL